MDADELRVILTAYQPVGTHIWPYVKLQSATDTRNFDDIEWTGLYYKSETLTWSAVADRYDYNEFEFRILPGTVGDLVNGGGAMLVNDTIQYKDANGVLYTSFKKFALKFVMISDSFNVVPRLKDIRALALS